MESFLFIIGTTIGYFVLILLWKKRKEFISARKFNFPLSFAFTGLLGIIGATIFWFQTRLLLLLNISENWAFVSSIIVMLGLSIWLFRRFLAVK